MSFISRCTTSSLQWLQLLHSCAFAPLNPSLVSTRLHVCTFGKTESQVTRDLGWELPTGDQGDVRVGVRDCYEQVQRYRADARADKYDANADRKHHAVALVFPVGMNHNRKASQDFTQLVLGVNDVGVGEHEGEVAFAFHPLAQERRHRAPWPTIVIAPQESLLAAMDAPPPPAGSSTALATFSRDASQPLDVAPADFDALLLKARRAAETPPVVGGVARGGSASIPKTFSSARPKKQGKKGKRKSAR
jgi:hypothetical protein